MIHRCSILFLFRSIFFNGSSIPFGHSFMTEEQNSSEIQLLLSEALSDRANILGAERQLRRIITMGDPQVERVIGPQAQLNFIDAASNLQYPDNVQCYLEMWNGKKKLLLGTFGGEGTSIENAYDDASWQALEFLYIFGGFAPSTKTLNNSKQSKENERGAKEEINLTV